MADQHVFVHVPGARLTHHQKQQITEYLEKIGLEKIVISDGMVQIGMPAPYQFTEGLGEYQTSYGFPTQWELDRWVQKQKPGYWYDWQSGESNHPNWGRLCSGNTIITDKETGDEVRRVEFYHEGTHYVDRITSDADGKVVPSDGGNLPHIIETRELFVSERAEVPEATNDSLPRPTEGQSLQFKVGDEAVARVHSFEFHKHCQSGEIGSEDLT